MYRVIGGLPLIDEYRRLREEVGWSVPLNERCTRALANTMFGVVARDSTGRLVGMGRVVGDGGMYLLLVDVAVTRSEQGKGIGGRIISRLHLWAKEAAAPHVALVAAPELVDFYRRCGFQEDSARYMRA